MLNQSTTDGRTDRQTDRQTTCDRNTALCTKVYRAVKTETRVRKFFGDEILAEAVRRPVPHTSARQISGVDVKS